MKKGRLTLREYILVSILLILLLGVCYYMFYYTPLQNDLQSIRTETSEIQSEIEVATAQYASMSKMQAELDEIFSNGKDKVTEIAPYDNAKVVMSELNGILSQSLNYKLSFADPIIEADGTVRRTVGMSFSCNGYDSAKRIINNLCSSRWRCLMKNISVNGDKNIVDNQVTCNATIVFFESKNLS